MKPTWVSLGFGDRYPSPWAPPAGEELALCGGGSAGFPNAVFFLFPEVVE